ncbi:MAG: type II toxin-antitoxin system RelB/DinJ family antitoxin, partial [Minisyncoccales bacterium]
AQAIAKKMGLNLSDVLNVFLHTFIRTRKLDVDLEEPSDWFIEQMAEAERERAMGEVSPMFSNMEDAIKWLDSEGKKYAR